MPESPSHSGSATSVTGGASTQPTPANNVGGGEGLGDKPGRKGGSASRAEGQGPGHIDVSVA